MEIVASIFFDMEKAYDTTWKYGILKDLRGFDLRGRLPLFIVQCFKDISFTLQVRSIFSDRHTPGNVCLRTASSQSCYFLLK